jgi:nucleotide-binding universal stress UspA family protein
LEVKEMYDKILVPLDGSELAEVALPYAEELAGRLGSEGTLLYVSESAEGQYHRIPQFYMEETAKATRRGAERYLEKPEGKAIKVESAVLVGHPADEIVAYADKEDIGLIVMATHGRSGIKRLALGSVAEKVVRTAKQPVALIRAKGARPDVREKGMLNKALVPLDGSKESEAVIPYIEELASKLKGEVVLLQVLAQTYHVITGGEGISEIPYTDEEMEPLRASAGDYLKTVAGGLEGKGITTRSEVRVGAVAEEIIKLADELYVDMVAMSTHGRSGVSRWAFGSIADKVLHAGNTPLLLVRVS